MELRTYISVVWRWRWFALALAAATFVASLAIQTREPTLYTASIQLALRPAIAQASTGDAPAREQYYEYTTAEYLNDDIMDVVQSPTFQTTVAKHAAASLGRPVNASIDAKKAHKLMKFNVTADTPEEAEAVAKSIATLLADPQADYFGMFVTFRPEITVVDDIVVAQTVAPSRVYLYMLLRVIIALVAGLGLSFLLEYLDDTLRSAREVETVTGLAVLAEIPARRGRGRGRSLAPTAGEGKVQTA